MLPSCLACSVAILLLALAESSGDILTGDQAKHPDDSLLSQVKEIQQEGPADDLSTGDKYDQQYVLASMHAAELEESWPSPVVKKIGLDSNASARWAQERAYIFKELLSQRVFPPKDLKSKNYSDLHPFTATSVLMRILVANDSRLKNNMSRLISPDLYNHIYKHLFYWVKGFKSVAEIYGQRPKWRYGILMCLGNRYFPMAVAIIRVIREVFKCNLPIEIFFAGDRDLSPQRQKYLTTLPNIHLRNLEHVIDIGALQLEGYAIKPLSLPFSWAREVLVVDADAVLFKSPSSFFNNHRYQATGALFFKDKLVGNGRGMRAWIDRILPSKSPLMEHNQMYREISAHMLESTCLAINRSLGQTALLLTALLNSPMHISELTAVTLGDKESFWIAYELLRMPYEFNPQLTAMSGSARSMVRHGANVIGTLCNQNLHLDEQGQPWFNDGGFLYNKRDTHSKHEPFDHILDPSSTGFVVDNGCYRGALRHPPELAVRIYNAYRALYNPNL